MAYSVLCVSFEGRTIIIYNYDMLIKLISIGNDCCEVIVSTVGQNILDTVIIINYCVNPMILL